MNVSRRAFLQALSVTVLAARVPFTLACSTSTSSTQESDTAFPQGLASGDPKPTRVILWTRVEPTGVGRMEADAIDVTYVIATDEALSQVVATGVVPAKPEGDHTVRVAVDGLTASTRYYYRFEVAGLTTQVGRTKTAPTADADVPINFAFASCQDYIGRYYHSWKALVDEGADLDFVLFVGDYIYETNGDPSFQTPTEDRKVTFVDGLDISAKQDRSSLAALSLADYRILYKTYRSDPHLKEVHRLYPFVSIWDDHEYADDCWQDHSTYFNEKDPKTGAFTDEKNTPRRLAANQAWFEYQVADVTFDATQTYPDEMKIYRQLRFGQHVDLFMTDERLYRADHLIPEGPENDNVGHITVNSSAGSRYLVVKSSFDALEAPAKPTMLGETQKAWFTNAVKGSNATWKVWSNEVQLWQMVLDLTMFPNLPSTVQHKFYYDCDQWDGYRSERAEILTALAGVSNLVACTGDIHAHFASELYTDFDTKTTRAGVEYVTAGISSSSMYKIVTATITANTLLRAAGLLTLLPQLDATLVTANPHLKMATTDANGLCLVAVTADAFDVTYLTVGDVLDANASGVTKRAKFRTVSGSNQITAA